MKRSWTAGVLLSLLLLCEAAAGQSGREGAETAMVAASSSSVSTGSELPDTPEASFGRGNRRSGMNLQYQTHIRPFSHVAVAVKVGLEGVGVDLATPLSNKWNLRGGISYLNESFNLRVQESSTSFGVMLQASTVDVVAKPRFRSATASVDWFPWYGSFRISPGVTLYNGNHGSAIATVEGGQVLSLGDGSYTSDPNDPIRAYASVSLGHKVAPKLTVGWGNMIPRSGKHFSFPFEVGVQYVGRPALVLTLSGSECVTSTDCSPITIDPTTRANLNQEQEQINSDIAPLRFYPILTTGVSYRF